MLEKTLKTRRDRVDWYPWMVRREAGESAAALAAEAGCDRRSIYHAWRWFRILTPAERAELRRQAFRRLTAKIESDALRGNVEGACKSARGLETVRRLLDAVEDEMAQHNERHAAGGQDDGLTPAQARAELLDRAAELARRRETKAIRGRDAGCGGDGGVPRGAALDAQPGPDPA